MKVEYHEFIKVIVEPGDSVSKIWSQLRSNLSDVGPKLHVLVAVVVGPDRSNPEKGEVGFILKDEPSLRVFMDGWDAALVHANQERLEGLKK